MHETSPTPDNNNDDELFKQLADLGMDDVNESIDYELEIIAETQESLQQQQRVIQLLKTKHPVFAEILKPFTPEAQYEMYDSVIELRKWLSKNPSLPEEIQYRAYLADAIYSQIWRIGDILSGIGDKTETQVQMIIDDILPPELKTILLDTLNELVPTGGINTSDPEETQKAIDQHRASEKNSEKTKALRIKVTNLFHIHERAFLEQHSIHLEDPVWSEIRAWSSTNIALRGLFGKDNHDIFSFGIKEYLAILRISEADFLALITRIEKIIED